MFEWEKKQKDELINKLLEKFEKNLEWYNGITLMSIKNHLEQFELRELEVLVKND